MINRIIIVLKPWCEFRAFCLVKQWQTGAVDITHFTFNIHCSGVQYLASCVLILLAHLIFCHTKLSI